MTPLEYMCSKETCSEILRFLPPDQLIVVALKWDGMNGRQIAKVLGITDQAVAQRLKRAQRRIAEMVPEARPIMAGRKSYRRGPSNA